MKQTWAWDKWAWDKHVITKFYLSSTGPANMSLLQCVFLFSYALSEVFSLCLSLEHCNKIA